MKKNLKVNYTILFSFCLIQMGCYSHDYQYEVKLDSIVNARLHGKEINSLRTVSENLFVNDTKEQVDLFAWWVLKYLKYDDKMTNATILMSLKKGRGVCRHYATFFDSLSKYRGLDSELISGYCKLFNQRKKTIETPVHAWNSIVINGEKLYLDLTWTDDDNFLDSLKLSKYYLIQSDPFYLSHFDKHNFFDRFLKLYRFKRSAVMYGSFYIMRKESFWVEDGFYRVKNISNGFYLHTKEFKDNVEFLDLFFLRGIFDEHTTIENSKIDFSIKETSNGVFFIESKEKLNRKDIYSMVLRVRVNDRIRDVVLLYGKK